MNSVPSRTLVAFVALWLSTKRVWGSQEKILSYEPISVVTDYAAIDLDQKLIEEQLAFQTDQGFVNALKVYTQGAFSKSYAEVQLDTPLPVDVAKGVEVFGQAPNGMFIRGSTAADFRTGEDVIQVIYYTTQTSLSNCHVGGNPEPNTEGCFRPTGSLEIGEIGDFSYTYNPLESNFNSRTLQGFSLEAEQEYYRCGSTCPYPTYDKFFRYYGIHGYANQWVMAAFNRGSTNFAKGNAEFNLYGMEGRTEAIKKATVYMNAWMYVIGAMEKAVGDCLASNSDTLQNENVFSWDAAVAVYTGSVPKFSGDGGYMLYTLAQKRCENFGTCLQTNTSSEEASVAQARSRVQDDGMAKVNSKIFESFEAGKKDLLSGDCETAEQKVTRIIQLMTVPLLQSTLRYAYVQDIQNDNREKAQAEGAVFAASVLPLVHACNESDAQIVYNNMRVGNNGIVSFEVVKAAFENSYQCLGILCTDVGGLVDQVSGGYLKGAEPCGLPTQGQPDLNNPSLPPQVPPDLYDPILVLENATEFESSGFRAVLAFIAPAAAVVFFVGF